MTATERYDAFVSYAHEQQDLVDRMQRDVERFAKPWWRSRRMRLYRDRTTMTATPDLWGTIVAAMEMSSKLVVVLSPAATASRWVNQEIEWWLGTAAESKCGTDYDTKPVSKSASDLVLVLVLVDGELEWGVARGTK